MKNAVIDSFPAYNQRHYGTPWVCTMNNDGSFNFQKKVGCYTGNARQGEAGDLIVNEPVQGQVYGYGQKDYRGHGTQIDFARWDGDHFTRCDRIGHDKEED